MSFKKSNKFLELQEGSILGIADNGNIPSNFLNLYDKNKFIFYKMTSNKCEGYNEEYNKNVLLPKSQLLLNYQHCFPEIYYGKYIKNIQPTNFDYGSYRPRLLNIKKNVYLFFDNDILEIKTKSPIERFLCVEGNSNVHYCVMWTKDMMYDLTLRRKAHIGLFKHAYNYEEDVWFIMENLPSNVFQKI